MNASNKIMTSKIVIENVNSDEDINLLSIMAKGGNKCVQAIIILHKPQDRTKYTP